VVYTYQSVVGLTVFEQISAVLFERPLDLFMFTHFWTDTNKILSAWNPLIPTDRFSWNLMFVRFSKICRENSSLIEVRDDQRALRRGLMYVYENITEEFFSDEKIFRQKPQRNSKHTGYVFNNLFQKSCHLQDYMQNMLKPDKTKTKIKYGACALNAE